MEKNSDILLFLKLHFSALEIDDDSVKFVKSFDHSLANLEQKQQKKMYCVSARRLSIHKTYIKFKNKFTE
jgi:hypothetical protein